MHEKEIAAAKSKFSMPAPTRFNNAAQAAHNAEGFVLQQLDLSTPARQLKVTESTPQPPPLTAAPTPFLVVDSVPCTPRAQLHVCHGPRMRHGPERSESVPGFLSR